jgi:hypothetical protein
MKYSLLRIPVFSLSEFLGRMLICSSKIDLPPVFRRYSALLLLSSEKVRMCMARSSSWTDCDDLSLAVVNKPALSFIILFFAPFVLWLLLSLLQNYLVVSLLGDVKVKGFV